MRIATVASHPQYWGSAATDAQSKRWSETMEIALEKAGFQLSHTESEGTTDEMSVYYSGEWDDEAYQRDKPYLGVDWFNRWCAHGFCGMVAWLKKEGAK